MPHAVCYCHVGISIVDADITTDIVEPADFNRYVSQTSVRQIAHSYMMVTIILLLDFFV